MPDSSNRLELDIVAVDDTGPATGKARANFRSVEQDAAKAAAGMSKGFDAATVSMSREIEKASAQAMRSLDALERRAALAGKSGVDKLMAQSAIGIKNLGGDEAAIQRYTAAMDKLLTIQQRADRAAATKQAGTRAGEAVLPGEAAFQDALKRVQARDAAISGIEGRARAATAAQVNPFDRIRKEHSEALSQFGQTEQGAKRITAAFNQIEEAQRNALRTERLQNFKDGFLNFALTVAAAGGVVKTFLLDTATYAARTDTLKIATQQLAVANNLGVHDVEKFVTLTKFKGITSQDASNTVNQMIVSGLDVAKAPELARVAQNQAQIAGSADGHTITSSEALSGIIHGIVERNISDLRTYAIAVSFQDVFDKWKHANPGKELSETQKTALALQAVLDFGARSAGVYGATMETVGKQMSSLPRFALEAKNAVGEQLGPALSEGVTILTRFFMTIEQHAGASAKLAAGIGTITGAFAAFKIGSFLAGMVGLEAAAGPIGWVAAGLTVLGGALLFTTDKFQAQRDAIALHAAQLNAQKESIKQAALSFEDYTEQIKQTDRALFLLSIRQAKALADERREKPKTVISIAGVPVTTYEGPQTMQGPDGKMYTLGQYESRFEHLGKNAGVTLNPELAKADKAAKDAEGTADRSRLAQESLTAAKEGRQLKSQLADLDITAKMKEVRARLEKGQLTDPSDIADALVLTRQHVKLETDQRIEDGRKRIDSKTGAVRDISGTKEFETFRNAELANGDIRLQVETKKLLDEFKDMDDRHFRARADADFKSWDEAQKRKASAAQSLASEIDHQEAAMRDHAFEYQSSSNDRQRDLALQQLGQVEAQTVKGKIAVEDQKLAIESYYAERSLAIQISKLESQRNIELSKLKVLADQAGPENRGLYDQAATDVNQSYQQQIDAARASTSDKEIIDAQKTANEKAKIQIESAKSVYQNLKQEAGSLFDQMVYHTKTWGEFFKGIVKTAVMTPIKDIFSSQLAGVLTQGLTGEKVSFGEVGNGQGAFGKLGSIFGRAGLGQPKFGDANHPLSNLNAPNHLGDVALVSGAVPVVIMNAPQVGAAHVEAARSGYGPIGATLANSFGMSILSGARNIQQIGPQTESYGAAESTWRPVAANVSPSGFPTIGEVAGLGTPSGIFSSAGDNPWVLPTPPPFDAGLTGTQLADWTKPNLGPDAAMAAPQSGGGGLLGSLKSMFGLGGGEGAHGTPPFVGGGSSRGGGLFGGLKSMFGLDTAGTDMGGGVGIARSGLKGNLAAISKSSGFALLGGMAAMDGIRRGGVLGTLEAAGGGAAVGFKYGGLLGAGIGAAIGGGLALAKTFGLFGGDRKHAKDLVKQIYGMEINNATADQIVAIAKQSYGSQIDVAVRSQQVRDLLKLYSQATGQKGAEDKFVQDSVHSASFTESGGKLFQNAVYDNGNAYSYSSPLATYGGVNTAPLQTYAPNQGVFSGSMQFHFNGQAATDAIAGQVVRVATPGFVQGQALAASGSSIGRTSQQNMALSPSALTR